MTNFKQVKIRSKKKIKELMSRMVEEGCIICGCPAEIHHNTHDRARGKKSDKFMPLCPHHHRLGGHGNAIHSGVQTWESIFGHQDDLCIKALERCGINNCNGDRI